MLNLRDIVFVPSVQHTGTWFTIRFLQNFFSRQRELTYLLEEEGKHESEDSLCPRFYQHPLNERTVAHIHFPIVRFLNFDVTFPKTRFERIWHENLRTQRSSSIDTILAVTNFFKTVIPIRDPLAAILTREARHPQFRHFFIVDGFVALAKEFARHPNVMFLPIDLPMSVEDREKLLNRILAHCEVEHDGVVVHRVAKHWPVENPTPGNHFKELYLKGDVEKLQFLMGPKWAEVRYLKNMASIILPFLASLGYEKQYLNLW